MTTKLLAVDDSKTMRKVLEITFAGDTYDSTVVGSADEALTQVRANPPQVVVVDGHLGNSSGYELCKQIKTEHPSVKVLLLSSKQRPYDAAAGTAAGVDDYFDKPFDSTKFLDKLSGIDLGAPAETKSASAAQRPLAPVATSSPAERPQISHGPSDAARPGIGRPVAPAAAPRPPGGGTALGDRPRTGSLGTPTLGGASRPAPARSQEPTAPPTRTTSSPLGSPPVVTSPSASSPSATSPRVSAPAAAPPRVAEQGAVDAVLGASMTEKLQGLGLTKEQVLGVLALSREVVEQVVWEVVPALAETMIKEEIERLTAE